MAITDKINIDFQILDTHDPRVILIADTSTWGHLERKPAILEVTLPGDKKYSTSYFKMGSINVWNSSHFNLTCPDENGNMELIDLPDGVYSLKLKGSPSSYNKERYYLRTVLLESQIDRLVLQLGSNNISNNKKAVELLVDINMLLESAHANLRYSNIATVQSLIREVKTRVEKALDCVGCVDVD